MSGIQSEIYSGGNLISRNIVKVDITKEFNRIPYAEVVLCESDVSDTQGRSISELSNDDSFKPGKEVELTLNQGDESGVFKGIVVKQKLRKTQTGSFLTIELKDNSYKLCFQRKSAVFENLDDCQIIKSITGKKNIQVDCTEKTYKHKQVVQYYCSDWDFIISRVEANGLLTSAENGKLVIQKPNFQKASTEISNVYDFEMEADLGGQYQEFESVYWDVKNAQIGTSVDSNSEDLEKSLESEVEFDQLSQSMNNDKFQLINGVHSEQEEMKLWANAGMMKNRLSMLRGRVTIDGNPKIKLGDSIKVSEVGDVFNANTIVTGIRHRITKEGWKTDLQCGLSNKWFHANRDIIETPASGLLPGIHGLQVGVVDGHSADGDPEKLHRIKVKIPTIHETKNVVWARLLFPYAGDNRGMFFIPEEGDEVVIGFFNDDPRHAVIIGSLYNGIKKPPLDFTNVNNEKGIITRNGIKILFKDEKNKEAMELSTPGGNRVLMEDENGIEIEDINENTVTFHDRGVELIDKNDNKFTLDDKGIVAEDTNKNSIVSNKQGVEIKDSNGNIISLSDAGIEIKDMAGNKAVLSAGGVNIRSGAVVAINGSAISLG